MFRFGVPSPWGEPSWTGRVGGHIAGRAERPHPSPWGEGMGTRRRTDEISGLECSVIAAA